MKIPAITSHSQFLMIAAMCLLMFCTSWAQNASGGLQGQTAQVSAALVARAIAQICPQKATLRNSDGSVTGCNTCPRGTSVFALGGSVGKIRWVFSGAMIGHYTSANASNILIAAGGDCEPHSYGYGGTYVFALHKGSPELLRYDPGLLTPCRRLLLRDGRNFLVCQGDWLGQGELSQYVTMVVFDSLGRGRRTFLFKTQDTTDMCPDGPSPMWRSRILSVEFPDLSVNGQPDLSITVTLGKETLTPAERKGCEDSTFNPDAIPVKTYTVDYVFNGTGFRPTPAARRILKLFDPLPPPQ